MLRPHHHHSSSGTGSGRRRSLNAPQICAGLTAALLLLSLFVLHSRLSSSSSATKLPSYPFPLFDDADNDAFDLFPADDRIDASDSDDPLHPSDLDEDLDLDLDDDPQSDSSSASSSSSSLFFDHALGVHRRSFGKPGPDPDPEPDPVQIKIAFSSDDAPIDDNVRSKTFSVRTLEDLLMVRSGSESSSPLRDGWAWWLEGKGDFLRRDRMLRSNLEMLNPKNHPLLQDPDVGGGAGSGFYTRGDRLVQRSIWKEMENVPFPAKGSEVRARARARKSLEMEKREEEEGGDDDGRGRLGFSGFVERFFETGKSGVRVFMVWNSPPWMFGVRHQRGVESLFKVHRDACVMMLSETMEADFFESFVKDGFKVAVAMPDLDELLKDTPTNEFASLWYQWRQTRHYPVHYSELVRLAALYKYGGIYIDSDVIVLKPLHSLKNSVTVENQTGGSSIFFNGAVMAFDKNSPFLMECLREFYSTYDEARLQWNGADLMTRVYNRLNDNEDKSSGHLNVKIESPLSFPPVSSTNITRYFAAATDEIGRLHDETLFAKILNESTVFHFWNSLTSALVPEPNSLVERLLNHNCLRCRDIL